MNADIALDHVVAVAQDPRADAGRLAPLGLVAAPGGRHPAWGTENVLVPLAHAYLEFLGVGDRAVAERSPFGRSVLAGLADGPGLWRVALRCRDLEGTLRALRAAGIAVQGPVPGERQLPDGSFLRWQLAFPDGPAGAGTPPMLIHWDRPDLAPSAGRAGAAIASVHIAARDPQGAALWYAKAFAATAEAMTDEACGPSWRVAMAGGDLVLCADGARAPGLFALSLGGPPLGTADEARIGRALYRLAKPSGRR